MSREYLSDNNILVVSKPLAQMLGVGMSIVLRRVQHWLEFNEHQGKDETHFRDGRWWAYNGYQKWTDDIAIYSKSSIKRLFTELEKLHLILSDCKYNKRAGDQTKWYSIDYEAYDHLISLWREHNCPMHLDGKQSRAYQTFLKAWMDQWTTVGIPTVVPPMDYSSTTNGLQRSHQETTVVPPLPESPSDGSSESLQSAESVLTFPAHMVAFEQRNNGRTHTWVQQYSDLIGQKNRVHANKREMDLLLERERQYTEAQFIECAREKLRTKPGCKLLFILEDMPNLIAAKSAPKADYHTMSPAVEDQPSAPPLKGAALEAHLKAERAKYDQPALEEDKSA